MTMFGDKLKELRQRSSMTQDDLAGRLFVSRALVAKWEAGKRYPDGETLKNVAEVFGISYDELVGDDSVMTETGSELEECIPADRKDQPGEESSPDDVAIAILTKKITSFLTSLPKNEKNMFLKRYYYYESVEKIAKETGLEADKTRVMLAEIRVKMMNFLEKEV